jgi:serine/alanine adding enzyme
MKTQLYNGNKTAWDDFVSRHPDATSYHQYGWREVVGKSFGHAAYYLACSDEDGTIHGILPLVNMQSRFFGNFMVSLPFFNYGGLLSDSEQADHSLLKAADSLRQHIGASSIELRHFAAPHGELPAKTPKVTMIIDLSDNGDRQWKGFNAKLRNQIRKAEKSGLQIVTGGPDLLDGFYQVFCRNMRDLGTPVYGIDFFRNILNVFPQTTKIFSVTHNDTIIASGIASWFRDTLELPWASSIRKYKSLCPNNILYWGSIKFAIEQGFSKFDFGRSTPNEGTYRFKEQWGAQPVPLYWQYLLGAKTPMPELNPKNPKYRLAISLWQKLPVGLTKILGPPIVRNIP